MVLRIKCRARRLVGIVSVMGRLSPLPPQSDNLGAPLIGLSCIYPGHHPSHRTTLPRLDIPRQSTTKVYSGQPILCKIQAVFFVHVMEGVLPPAYEFVVVVISPSSIFFYTSTSICEVFPCTSTFPKTGRNHGRSNPRRTTSPSSTRETSTVNLFLPNPLVKRPIPSE